MGMGAGAVSVGVSHGLLATTYIEREGGFMIEIEGTGKEKKEEGVSIMNGWIRMKNGGWMGWMGGWMGR